MKLEEHVIKVVNIPVYISFCEKLKFLNFLTKFVK